VSDHQACEMLSPVDSLLLWVARHDLPKTLSALLEEGADIEVSRTTDGYRALMFSAWFGHLRSVEVLLRNGAGTEARNNDGATALACAAQRGYIDIVKLLLRYGADQTVVDNDGDTPASTAEKMGHTAIALILSPDK